MEGEARSDLVRKLGALYKDAVGDEGVRDRVVAEPRTVLAEHGIQLPPTVRVEVEVVPAHAPRSSLDDLLAEWDRMVERGTLALKLPASRPADVGTTELTDEQLERVSGGADGQSDGWDAAGYEKTKEGYAD